MYLSLKTHNRRLLRAAATLHMCLARMVWGQRPLPLRYWITLKQVARRLRCPSDVLVPATRFLKSDGACIPIRELQPLLKGCELGTWSLDRFTVELLWRALQRDQPTRILECGSGVSTIVFGWYARQRTAHGGAPVWIVSLEQEASFSDWTNELLYEQGLSRYARVLYAPLSKRWTYMIDPAAIWDALQGDTVDYILIDGPAGPEGCRTFTLQQLAPFCSSGAKWFLDDALRDGELRVLESWAHLPGIAVQGIYPVGKGLATGFVMDPDALQGKRQDKAVVAVTLRQVPVE